MSDYACRRRRRGDLAHEPVRRPARQDRGLFAGYLADHWCEKGHIVFCVDGRAGHGPARTGRVLHAEAGMSYQVADGASRIVARARARGARRRGRSERGDLVELPGDQPLAVDGCGQGVCGPEAGDGGDRARRKAMLERVRRRRYPLRSGAGGGRMAMTMTLDELAKHVEAKLQGSSRAPRDNPRRADAGCGAGPDRARAHGPARRYGSACSRC